MNLSCEIDFLNLQDFWKTKKIFIKTLTNRRNKHVQKDVCKKKECDV